MFTLRRLVLGEKMRLIMMFVFFVVFVIFGVQFISGQDSVTNIILSIVFLSFFAFFFLLSEVLRFIYRQATKALVVDCDPKLAEQYIAKITKLDIIKGYKNTNLVFYSLMYMDQGDFKKLDEHIENPIFQTSSSLKLIYNYNKFYIALHNDKFEVATKYFRLITEAYTKKTKKRKTAKAVYSFNLIAADYYIHKKNLTKAEQNLKAINEDLLNLRERTYYYISQAKFNHLKGNEQKEVSFLTQAKEISENLYHVANYA